MMKSNGFLPISFFMVISAISTAWATADLGQKWALENPNPDTLQDMYGDDNLADFPLFKGGLINFGYWRALPVKPGSISDSDRIRSSANMYSLMSSQLELNKNDSVLEVGSGLGVGCTILAVQFDANMTCLDASPAQTARAVARFEHDIASNITQRPVFLTGTAERLPFVSNTFDKILSIEAAQHFSSIELFIKESFRTLKKGGKIAITTFFATGEQNQDTLCSLLGTVAHGVDKVHPIGRVISQFHAAGFRDVRWFSIGSEVWPGYDGWIKQTEFKDTWNINWLKSYEDGLLDYFVITASK